MKTVFKFITPFVIASVFAFPALAQESTEPSPTAETIVTEAPVVVVEAPENVGTDYSIVLPIVLSIILLLGNILQSFWLYKSVPRDVANHVFERARLLAKMTPNPDDDKIVDAAQAGFNKLTGGEVDTRN